MKRTREMLRKIRHARVRRRVSGTPGRPRVCVRRAGRHIYAILVDDTRTPCRVLTAVSSLSPGFRSAATPQQKGGNVAGAELVGRLLAAKARELGITSVVFDRGGYRYTGRIKMLADALRIGGLKL